MNAPARGVVNRTRGALEHARGLFERIGYRLVERVARQSRDSPLLSVTAFGAAGFLAGLLVLFVDRPSHMAPRDYSHSGAFALSLIHI